MFCGWCETTGECIMGDTIGPYFGSCKEWSIVGNEESMKKCDGILNTGQKVGLGVGISLGAIILLIGGVWADRACHRRRKRADSELVQSG
jgi:hypothetical protein